jgi:hypothetical protein
MYDPKSCELILSDEDGDVGYLRSFAAGLRDMPWCCDTIADDIVRIADRLEELERLAEVVAERERNRRAT